ncbi:MAG: ATP-binding protein [Candidatus Omnitrophica bacterium]|nr:ATP-binding protein [Candidatus Omnitrophota bacterium]
MGSAIFIPIVYLHHLFVFFDIYKKKKKIIYYGYIGGLFFLILDFTPLFVKSLSPKLIFNFWPNPGIAFHPFLALWFWYVIYGTLIIIEEYRKSIGFRKVQLRYVLLATFIGWFGGLSNYPLWYNIHYLPYGNILVSGYIIILTYAILRHRLLETNLALTRTGIFVVVYSFVLGIPFAVAIWLRLWLIGIVDTGWWIVPMGLMGLLATVGPFIYIKLESKAEAKLLKEQKRYQDTLKQASVGMTRIRNLNKLLNLIAHIVTKTVRISYAAIYLLDKDNNEYILEANRGKPKVNAFPKLGTENPLIFWIKQKQTPLVYEEVKHQMQDSSQSAFSQLEENMRALGAAVIVPSFLENELTGFIILGEKISKKIYSQEDLNVFSVLASQAALAIENAQFYDEAKEMQNQIAQAEKMATIGTMADGLSHQINNRFYALSLIAGDTIDTIKMSDTSQCSPEIKEMISQISHALDRIQANVMQGGEVVKGILKYTRKGDEGFEALTMDQIIDGTLAMVQYKVKLTEIDIIRDYTPELPKIKGNLVQLEEVFFNFIDNAYDAIVERRTSLKEEGYRGKINVKAANEDGIIKIEIQDNGMGIKDENLKKLFTPFFTTKVSSRRGTGLGLYVIDKIITDTHKGKIALESKYKQGTKFTLQLPKSE